MDKLFTGSVPQSRFLGRKRQHNSRLTQAEIQSRKCPWLLRQWRTVVRLEHQTAMASTALKSANKPILQVAWRLMNSDTEDDISDSYIGLKK